MSPRRRVGESNGQPWGHIPLPCCDKSPRPPHQSHRESCDEPRRLRMRNKNQSSNHSYIETVASCMFVFPLFVTWVPPCFEHGSHEGPVTSVGVKDLTAVVVRGPIPTPYCVESVIDDPHTRS
jgi:hypothetical protein